MKSVPDFVFSLFRFLGLLDEPPPIRTNFKRNRTCDDFLSDEETTVLRYKVKRICSSNTPTNEGSNEGFPGLSTSDLSCLLRKSTPIIDAARDGKLEEQKVKNNVAWVESKNTKKEPAIVHLALNDDDDSNNQQNDDVIFVKKVNLNATSIRTKPMSKRKPVGDGNLATDAELFRLPQKTRINVFNKINSDNELNSDMYQHVRREHGLSRVYLTDSSDSDVEVVPPKSTTFSKWKDSKKDLADKSRSWLLELESKYKVQNNQENTSNVTHRESGITSNVNRNLNEASSSKPENIKEWLAKIDAKYFSTPRNTHEKPNDGHPDLRIVSNSEDIAGHGPSRLEFNNSDLLRSQDNLNGNSQESKIASKLNTEQNEANPFKLNNINDWLARLESTYLSTPQKIREDVESNIIPKVNSRQNDVHSSNLETPIASILKAEGHEASLHKTLEKLVDERRKSDIYKINSEQKEARSYLPSTSREWLLELDSKYKSIPQKSQEILNNARRKLNTMSNMNSEQKEIRSPKLDSSTADWLMKLESKYTAAQKAQGEPYELRRESGILPRVYSNQNKVRTYNADQEPSKLESKHKIMRPMTEEKRNDDHQDENNLSKVSKQKSALSFKFDTSEDLISKLGSLYEKDRQKTYDKSNNACLMPDFIKQASEEQSDIEEIQSNAGLPVLSPAQEELVDRALVPEPEEELLIEKFNIKIHRRDLQTLSDINWLNDEVINFYMNLIMQRSEERKDLPKVYATNTFFYPKLMQSGQAGLRRWTRKVDIFSYDLFMVPVNVGNHWCISLIDFRVRIIKYLDSQGMPNEECLDALLQYLKDEHKDKKGAPFDDCGWNTECLQDIPQQMNGSDCGMFACTFAEFSSRNAAYSFTQAHMPYLRRKAALEILTGKLML